jgi:CubicO group peptidase (beta-lactamase class C family)
MTTVIAYHEIDDSEHWLASPKREEIFGPLGITHRTFLDPENPKRAAVLAEVPDMDAFQAVMQSQDAADAMRNDGVRADTLVMMVEA